MKMQGLKFVSATALFILLSLSLSGCAPGAFGSPTGPEAFHMGPYPTTSRATRQSEDSVFAALTPVGPGLGLQRGPWQGLLLSPILEGARARVSWDEGPFSVAVDAAYLEYRDYEGNVHQSVGLALDGAYLTPLPSTAGEAYAGPRARAYLRSSGSEQVFGLLPGFTIGVRFPLTGAPGPFSERVSYGLEASLLIVSPLLTEQDHWSVFTPFGLTLSIRF